MIYLDYAAATPIHQDVLKSMKIFLEEQFVNPSAFYGAAQVSRFAIDQSRKSVGDVLGCLPEEIFFTSGGTESNNWALFGAANGTTKNHIIISQIEHPSVLHPAQELERRGYKVTYLPVNRYGQVEVEDIKKAITPETFLVSILYGQNEIGTIQDVKGFGEYLRGQKILFHTDACQAAGALSLSVKELSVDLMSLNGGKIYGPKGVGVLYIRKGAPVTPLLYGGGQEHRLRGGTENVAGIVGFATALFLAEKNREEESERLVKLREKLLKGLMENIEKIQINGHLEKRLPNNLSVTFFGVSAESLLVKLDQEGVCASAGSACTSGALEPSHVLRAIGLSNEDAKSTIRLSMGKNTTLEEIEKATHILQKSVKELRERA